jgi:hypothetical protein
MGDRRRISAARFIFAKDSDSGRPARNGLILLARTSGKKETIMSEKTCAACDYELEENAIAVTIGGKIVEVCCEECAQALKEAQAAAGAQERS